MTPTRRSATALGLAAASVLALAGCASTAADETGSGISVVASTNVYGQIAEEIGSDLVDVTSIVANASQDPHSFEASARDQLAVSKADLVIENGGGYDAFIDGLIESGGTEATVLTAVEFSPAWEGGAAHDDSDEGDDHADHDHVEGFNEHVWYDPATMADLARGIASELGVIDPENAATFEANADAFAAAVDADLVAALDELAAAHGGEQVFATEPVPVYLVEAAGLENATPEKFSEAVEEGQDVAPATLLEALALVKSGDVRVVITNTQTGGAETQAIVDEAEGLGIPVIAFSETLPEGQTYVSWMQANIEALSTALGA